MEFLVFRSWRFQETQLVNKNEQLKCKRWYLFWTWKWFFPASKGRSLPQRPVLPGPSCSRASRQPASTIMNWNNIYWKGIGRCPVGWRWDDSQQPFTTFSQNFILFFALKICMDFYIAGRRRQRRGSGRSQYTVSDQSCILCDCVFIVNI